MSIPLPSTTVPPLSAADPPGTTTPLSAVSTSARVPQSSLQMVAGASSSAVGIMTNEQLTAAVLDLGKMVAGIHGFLLGSQPNPPPPSQQQQLPPPLPLASSTALYSYGMPHDDTATTTSPASSVLPAGVPIQDIKFPHSPSPTPAWLTGTSPPVYSTTTARTSIPQAPHITAGFGHGGAPASATLYGGGDGALFHSSSPRPPPASDAAPSAAAPTAFGAAEFQLKGYKLDFTTYDGSVDPLN
ncbi:lysine-rich arabinogalactan protein 19-like [Miscanthus floridulus]|uniref:lysine-rich arabinogalactan protein 19-like n=1 Tax=Miscanthus floridulus TaxID=154761 RepID=UPI003459CADF